MLRESGTKTQAWRIPPGTRPGPLGIGTTALFELVPSTQCNISLASYPAAVRWVVVALLVIVGGYMVFDGVRALTVGDYLTPSSGEYAGQLGPWSRLVDALGIPPRGTPMKVSFVVLGTLHLAAAGFLASSGSAAAAWLAGVAAASGLWYLPFGTAADGLVIVLLATTSLRP